MLSTKKAWIKWSESVLNQNEKLGHELERELKRAYSETLKNINKDVNSFYGKYAKDNQISLSDAKKRLKPDELNSFKKMSKEYINEVNKLGNEAFTNEYKKYLKSLSSRAYISRLQELELNIRHNIEKLSSRYANDLNQVMENSYKNGYYMSMYEIDKTINTDLSFTQPSTRQLQVAIKEDWQGRNYEDSIYSNKNKLILEIRNILIRQFVTGQSVSAISKELALKTNISYRNAQRLIRTEITYISNKATIQAYEDSEVVTQYQYIATLDSRTSHVCRDMDTKIFDLKDAVVGVNLPPLHPNCRSTTIPYYADNLLSDRVARDEMGKSRKLGEFLSYKDWVDKYADEDYKQLTIL